MRTSRYRIATAEVEMASADTEYEWTIPEGARDIEVKLADSSVAWRWSDASGAVASASGGHPVPAGGSMADSGVEHTKQTLYFAHSDASSQTLKVAYNVPMVR